MQFHDPKNMSISIVLEAAELLEHFQWKTKKEAQNYIKNHKEEIADEIADIVAACDAWMFLAGRGGTFRAIVA